MSDHPMVSTLTSCYRGEKYLPLFLEKMPEQEAFDRLEVVLDLNAPTPEELRTVKRFQELYPDHIRFTVQDKVITYSASWNNCIRSSRGDYLAVWNIDDLRTPDSIAKQAKLLDERPDIGIDRKSVV
jgi:glycosyltransferase involved in cell wall biosynthesis